MSKEYQARVDNILQELGISPGMIAHRRLRLFYEPAKLELSGKSDDGREHLLVPEASQAWRRLSGAAATDGVHLFIVSAFRSLERQAEVIRGKQQCGLAIEQILLSSAPPGYSEHHSGRAVDVTTPGCPPLEEAFEHTTAFEWLSRYAGKYGFFLSFPRGNECGYLFEPWHWCYRETA